MNEYEIRFNVSPEIENKVNKLYVIGDLEIIKFYEFEDFYYKKEGSGYARIRKWYKPQEKVEIVYTDYKKTFAGKKGEKIKIPIEGVENGKVLLKSLGFEPLLNVKKLNGKHYKFVENEKIRIALEDVYVNEEFFDKMGEIEIVSDNDEEAKRLLNHAISILGIENYSTKSLLEILLENYS